MYDRSLDWTPEGQEPDEGTRLRIWQQRLSDANAQYDVEEKKMDKRERLYNGDNQLEPLVPGDTKANGDKKRTSHVRNIVFENIESMVSSSLPTPKVTAKHKEDERLAAIIEHWLRNEMDRLPFETMNDMAERTVPMQGGTGWLVEWDNTKTTHCSVGETKVSLLHPKLFAPQPGVYTGIEDMDWFIIKAPTTKASVAREYGVDVFNLGEEEPELRTTDDAASRDEMLTKYIGYEKNGDGGIDRFVWVNSKVLENIQNYQARHQQVCRSCHKKRPMPGQIISNNVEPPPMLPSPGMAGSLIPEDLLGAAEPVGAPGAMTGAPAYDEELAGALGVAEQLADRELAMEAGALQPDGILLEGIVVEAGEPQEPVKYKGGPCPYCGADDWRDAVSEYEEVVLPIKTELGTEIPGGRYIRDENGMSVYRPTLIPYYKPNRIPIVLQRNVSVYGQLLGNSDVDAIQTQQNTVNRLSQKIIDRLIKAGTRISLPPKPNIRIDTEDSEKMYLDNPADLNLIKTFNFTGNIEGELAYMALSYEESRQVLGITNSFQGREDRTATSGIAKEFQAAQSAGRLESKRVMKAAAYAELFELMFKFQLAYSDEPRSVSYRDHKGDVVYETFNRYDFLKQDADGVWYWNDEFLFSVDSNQALEANRTAMWQETRMNLQSGAFGDPTDIETLILFWSKMEELHYPGAGATRKFLEERREAQAAQASMMQQMQGGMGNLPSSPGMMRPEEATEDPDLKTPGEIRDNLNMATAGP